MHMFLQVLDDGRLTDGQGRTVSFKDTIIIMTSNAGTGKAEANVGLELLAKVEPTLYLENSVTSLALNS